MIRRLFAPFVFLATLLPAAPAVPLVNLVDERAMFALSVTDAPALLRGWDAGSLASTWTDEQIARFVAPLRTELKMDTWDDEAREATGLSVRELLELAQGEVLLALPATDLAKIDGKNPPPLLLAVEVGDRVDKLKRMLAETLEKEKMAEETEEFSGVTVHTRTKPRPADDADTKERPPTEVFSWAVIDGVWVISPKKERVLLAIDAWKQGGVDAALGKSERFLRTRERTAGAQAIVYVNFPAIYPALRDAVATAKAKNRAAGRANPLGLDYEMAFAALGLDALGEGYAALRIDEAQTRVDGGLLYTEERGLLKLLAYQPGAAPRPDWIPSKWPSVSTSRFRFLAAYQGLEDLLKELNPLLYGMAQGRIESLNKRMHIDLKRDLIGSLGDEIVTAYALPPGVEPGTVPAWAEMDQLIAVSLGNEATFVKSLEALKSLAGPSADQMFTKRDYLGHTVYTLAVPSSPEGKARRGFSYAIANGMFFLGIGSATTVENALQGMASKDGGFWNREDVKAVLADIPEDAAALQVQDLRVLMASFIETAIQMQTLLFDQHTDGNRKIYLDVSARPDAELIARYWGLSMGYVTRTSEGLFFSSRLAHPKK